MSRTAELLLGEWEGLIGNLEKLEKSNKLENKLDKSNCQEKHNKSRSPLHEQTNTLGKEKPGKENSEPVQLFRSQEVVVEEDVQRNGKKIGYGGADEKRQEASKSEIEEVQKGRKEEGIKINY